MNANFQFLAFWLVHAPTPTIIWINDGYLGRAEIPKTTCCTFQLTVEEARATPDVLTNMYSFIIIYS